MKLSEAIREGCKYGPKAEGAYERHLEGDKWEFCAMGAACRAVNMDSGIGQLHYKWPYITNEVPHPISGKIRGLNEQIAVLNDEDGWSREAIAEWVETIERKLGLWDTTPEVKDSPVVVEATKASLEAVAK